MFATAHFTSGVAVGLALGFQGADLALFIAASVLTDWDYGLQVITGRNHRTFLSHSPPVAVALLLPLGLWFPAAWVVLSAALLHYSLDLWEYGLRLDPFRNEIFGARLLPGIESMRFGDYLRRYFKDARFLAAEIALALAAIVLVTIKA